MLSREVGWYQLCNHCRSPFMELRTTFFKARYVGRRVSWTFSYVGWFPNPMTAVRSPLRSGVEKLKAEFVMGYWPGSACFYVSLKSFSLAEKHVHPADRQSWSEQWQVEDRKFEALLSTRPEFSAFSNKFFFVWDGNHRHTAWCKVISKLHPNEASFHVPVRAVVIEPSLENRYILLNAMSDWNRYDSNFHSFESSMSPIQVPKQSSTFIFLGISMCDSSWEAKGD